PLLYYTPKIECPRFCYITTQAFVPHNKGASQEVQEKAQIIWGSAKYTYYMKSVEQLLVWILPTRLHLELVTRILNAYVIRMETRCDGIRTEGVT
ncbi:hypothetical protein INT48_001576, partial [Thamnidium elegans]